MELNKYVDFLGLEIEDKITKFRGTVTSVSFDLYGCIQVLINPGVDENGKLKDCCWLDVNRLIVTNTERRLPVPSFKNYKEVAEVPGPENKILPPQV